jgi:hypothetical protein
MLGDGIPNKKDIDEVCIRSKRDRSPRGGGNYATSHPTLSVGTDTGRFSCYPPCFHSLDSGHQERRLT